MCRERSGVRGEARGPLATKSGRTSRSLVLGPGQQSIDGYGRAPAGDALKTALTNESNQAGLTTTAALAQRGIDGPNELPAEQPRSLLHQSWEVIRQPMLLLLLVAGTVNFLLAEPLDGAILLLCVLVVIGISIVQGHKTENALAALRDLSSPRALVIRDGAPVRIPGRDVVRGDVIVLAEGDRVPADAVVVEAANLQVDESALTGESVPVRKLAPRNPDKPVLPARPGGDATPFLFSGTLVVKGRGIANVTATGARTELGGIGNALKTIKSGRTRLEDEIDRLVRIVALLGLMVAGFVVVAFGVVRGQWLEGVLAGIASAMAMLPEEFPVVLTVFLALGAWRLSQRRVLTRRPAVIETLGSVTVVCVDKTGTLTMNRMVIRELITPYGEAKLNEDPLGEQFHAIAEYGVLASPVAPYDPMDVAFRSMGERYLADTEHLHQDWSLVREYPLSDELLALSHVWQSPDAQEYVVATKGAPEAIADLCHLSPDARVHLTAQVDSATENGFRVLGVARSSFRASSSLPTEQHDFAFEFLGLACLQDPVRPGVPKAVKECALAGIRTVMITGDYPGTAMAIARETGIDCEGGCMTGQELAALTDAERTARIRTVSVFARMVPEQKLQLIRALKENNEVVAMTGDGVNDAPALRAADIGIAMGQRGTDVARESAGLAILDDDFASIVGGIRHGRGIFDNLRKAMAYIIAVHVPIVGMSTVPLFSRNWPLVLLPIQIAFLELIIDPACSVVFEAEDVDPEIMTRRPRPVGQPMFDRRVLAFSFLQGLSVFASVLGVYVWCVIDDRSDAVVRSVTFVTLVLSNLCLILVNRSWRLSVLQTFIQRRNPTLRWILLAVPVLLTPVLGVKGLRSALNFGPIRLSDLVVATAAALLGVTWFEVYKLMSGKQLGASR